MGELSHPIVIAEQAIVIHDNDCLRARRDERLSLIQIDTEGSLINIAKHRLRARSENGLEVSGVVKGRGDYLIPWADTNDEQAEMDSGVARADGGDIPVGSPQV